MKNRIFVTSAFLGLFAIFAVSANAQKVGGYKSIAADDAGARAAAEFAVKEQAKKTSQTLQLVSVEVAERQVVGGSNYKLCLIVNKEGDMGEEDEKLRVTVVVYQNLKQEYSLTSWDKSTCGQK